MQRYARLGTAVTFGVVTLFVTAAPLLLLKLPNDTLLLTQLPPALVFGVLWPPVLVATLLGAVFGDLFAKSIALRLGALYAACLGVLLSLPVSFVVMSSLG